MEERRKFPRWQISDKAYYKKEGEEELRECLSKDICCSGACISLSEALLPKTELDLRINVGNEFAPIFAKAKVMWLAPSREAQDRPFLAGVQFGLIKDADRDAIFNYVYKNNRSELVKRWWQGA